MYEGWLIQRVPVGRTQDGKPLCGEVTRVDVTELTDNLKQYDFVATRFIKGDPDRTTVFENGVARYKALDGYDSLNYKFIETNCNEIPLQGVEIQFIEGRDPKTVYKTVIFGVCEGDE